MMGFGIDDAVKGIKRQIRNSNDRKDGFKEFFSDKDKTRNPKLKNIKLTAEEKQKLQSQAEQMLMEHAKSVNKDAKKFNLMLFTWCILILGVIIFAVILVTNL